MNMVRLFQISRPLNLIEYFYNTFQCECCQCFTFKICNKIHFIDFNFFSCIVFMVISILLKTEF